jgi:hypothetical protein
MTQKNKCTEAELYDKYLKTEFDEIMSFIDYVKLMEHNGIEVIDKTIDTHKPF